MIKANYLLIPIICSLFIFLPYCYEQRLITSIFTIDFYLFWLVGCLCWLYNVLSVQLSFNRLKIAVTLGSIYVVFLFFLKTHSDTNSSNFIITLFSCIGIICYLQIISASKYYSIIIAILLLTFFIQIYIGYQQAIETNFENLSIKGQLFNSGFFDNYLASVIPLLFAGFIIKSPLKKYIRILFFISFIVSAILLSLTVARAAFIGSAVGCIVIAWLYLKKVIRKKMDFIFFTYHYYSCRIYTII